MCSKANVVIVAASTEDSRE